MDRNALKNEMITLRNELIAIKLLDPCFVMEGIKQCNCDDKELTNNHLKIAFENYFLEKKPVPIRFFLPKYRIIFMEELRERRELLYKMIISVKKTMTKKKSSNKNITMSIMSIKIPVTLSASEYYTERYNNFNCIIYKINNLFGFIERTMGYETILYLGDDLNLINSFKTAYEIIFYDFKILKTQLEELQSSLIDILNIMSENHKSVSQLCDNIEQESNKRYKSKEIYSEDGSTIIVDYNEKQHLSQLKIKVDEFLNNKMTLIDLLDKIITLTCDAVVYKNKINNKFKEYCSNLISEWENLDYEKTLITRKVTTNTIENFN